MTRIRLKLLLLALLPLVVLLPMLLGITMIRWINKFDDLLLSKVASDLRVAEQYFEQIEAGQAADLVALARSAAFEQALAESSAALDRHLLSERDRLGLDFFIYDTGLVPDLPAAAQTIVTAARPDAPQAGLSVLSEADLVAISPELAARAALPLVPTEAARPISREAETRGMVILAAARTEDGSAVLLGGRLLNRNLDVIDTMNDLIYRETAGGEVRSGTTTLFLDDVRISTNVRLFEGARALGTRVSEAVWHQVMDVGEPWFDRAFVVNDWYISGYVPLTDADGARIGMLYTGYLEAPFINQRNTTIFSLILAFVAVVGLSVPLFLRLARGVFAPLEQMTKTMAQVEAGTLDARIGPVSANDEIGTVARHLDRLLDQVQDRDEALRGYATNLNELVDKRTQELSEANKKLEATFAQLVLAEKLASLGEVTAGVAYEINNPVAVIQGNLEVLRAGLPAEVAEELKTEIELIDAQTHRINVIVGKLLKFSRPSEISDSASRVDVAKVVEDALVLVAADLRQHSVSTETTHDPAPAIDIVETELTQVLVNLMINASQAMGSGGVLSLQTHAWTHDGQSGAAIKVRDTGKGIAKDKIEKIFDPFFSTKPGEGSGLGLSISQALIARAGGFITVRSDEGKGSEFFIWCPAADNLSDTPDTP
ncbi:cache domain-containing protein [uncultured Roseobacter sp.]|uniref:sensor histidine kinase n=1 Tax=uncultured Roseobacter sp. TaxID=114847 RepID=UPI0026120FB8|nr:cache domain-containing protein [uncultured Roseobacter sp.]